MTSWCDKLASTATVGIRLTPHVVASEAYITALEPILSREAAENKLKFQIEQADMLSCSFVTDDGYKYSINHHNVSVAFNHRMKPQVVSGAPPTMTLTSKLMPYTELLDEVETRVREAVLLVPGKGGRSILRIGVVSTTIVSEDDLPPGFRKFIDYLSKPWRSEVSNFSVSVTSELEESDRTKDRCIHHLIRPEDEEKLFTLNLDWQRYYKLPRVLSSESLDGFLSDCKRAAINYFEDLAVGDRFDVATHGSE